MLCPMVKMQLWTRVLHVSVPGSEFQFCCDSYFLLMCILEGDGSSDQVLVTHVENKIEFQALNFTWLHASHYTHVISVSLILSLSLCLFCLLRKTSGQILKFHSIMFKVFKFSQSYVCYNYTCVYFF